MKVVRFAPGISGGKHRELRRRKTKKTVETVQFSTLLCYGALKSEAHTKELLDICRSDIGSKAYLTEFFDGLGIDGNSIEDRVANFQSMKDAPSYARLPVICAIDLKRFARLNPNFRLGSDASSISSSSGRSSIATPPADSPYHIFILYRILDHLSQYAVAEGLSAENFYVEAGKILDSELLENRMTMHPFVEYVRHAWEEQQKNKGCVAVMGFVDDRSDETLIEDAMAVTAINSFIDYIESKRLDNQTAEAYHEMIFRSRGR